MKPASLLTFLLLLKTIFPREIAYKVFFTNTTFFQYSSPVISLQEEVAEVFALGQVIPELKTELFNISDRVGRIHLNNCSVEKIEKHFLTGKTIENLHLNENNIEILQKYTFYKILGLKLIWLPSNRIQVVENKAFSHLNKLKMVCLSGNLLLELNPDSFEVVPNLNFFELAENRLKELRGSCFAFMETNASLVISVCFNQIEKIELDAFSGLNSRNIGLNLAENKLKYVPEAIMKNWFRFKNLLITRNEITSFPESFYSVFNETQVLYTDNPFSAETEARILVWKNSSPLKEPQAALCILLTSLCAFSHLILG